MKKVKIISTNDIGEIEFERKINLLIGKGWKIRGGLIPYDESLYLLLFK